MSIVHFLTQPRVTAQHPLSFLCHRQTSWPGDPRPHRPAHLICHSPCFCSSPGRGLVGLDVSLSAYVLVPTKILDPRSVPPTMGLIPETKETEHSSSMCPVNSLRKKHKTTCLTSKSDFKGIQLYNFKLLQDLGWNLSFHKLCAKLGHGRVLQVVDQ